MIQDIAPSVFDNQFKAISPMGEDVIFWFKGSTLLGKRTEDDYIEYPTYVGFVSEYEKKGRSAADDFDFIYLCGVSGRTEECDKDMRFFMAMPKDKPQIGSFVGEMADDSVHSEYESFLEGYEFIGVNSFRLARPKELAFAAITAFHLYGWYRDNTYCGRCGSRLTHSTKERMLHCDCCNNSVYPKICPAVIVAVTNKDKLLLTKYAGRAYRNYALVAGFTEIGETVEETVIREVYEEVGLRVKNLSYYKSQPWGLSGSLLYGYFCEVDGATDITLEQDELSVGKWVSVDDIDVVDDGVSLTREMIGHFVKMARTTA